MSRAASSARHAVKQQHVTPHLPSRRPARIINNNDDDNGPPSTSSPKSGNDTTNNPLLTFKYYLNPTALNNPVLLHPTRDFASDPSHPFHIRTQRRLAAFDPEKFHWRVQCPVDVSKKAFIRNWAMRRVRTAVRVELERLGLGQKADAEGGTGSGEGKLGGALLIVLNKKGERTLTAKREEVREEVEGVLGEVRRRWEGKKRLQRREWS